MIIKIEQMQIEKINNDPYSIFLNGEKELSARNYVRAEYWFLKALKIDSNLKDINYALGVTYYNLYLKNGRQNYACKSVNFLENISSKDLKFKEAKELLNAIKWVCKY